MLVSVALAAASVSIAADLTTDQVRQLVSSGRNGGPADLAGKDLSGLDLTRVRPGLNVTITIAPVA
ncbi:MAG: hypothetical protein ABI316_12355 [Casimicrobiaceae bacterium]